MPKGSKPLPSQEILQEFFMYKPRSGELLCKKWRPGGMKLGGEAGWIDFSGYRCVSFFNERYYIHRLIYRMVTGDDPGMDEIDHKNLVRSDNRWTNLRRSTCQQNMWNHAKRKNNTSGFKGVSWCKMMQCWRAYVTKNYRQHRVGYFHNPEDAAEAVRLYRKKMHEQFTNNG